MQCQANLPIKGLRLFSWIPLAMLAVVFIFCINQIAIEQVAVSADTMPYRASEAAKATVGAA